MKFIITLLVITLSIFSAQATCIDNQASNCYDVTLERTFENDLYTYTFSVVNKCQYDLSYFAASLPEGEIGLNEYSNTNYTLENGTNQPFYSIKFEVSNNQDVMIFKFSTETEIDIVGVALKAGNSTELFSFQNCVSLPVELISFEGRQSGEEIVLKWSTLSESNNNFFDVMEYVNNQYSFVGRIDGNGTTTERSDYSFSFTPDSKGIKYYMLIQVDFDGKETTSEITSVFFDTTQNDIISIYPNLINEGERSKLIINGNLTNNLYKVAITDNKGNKIAGFKGLIMNEGEDNEIEISNTYTAGIYFVTFWSKGMNPVVKKLIIK